MLLEDGICQRRSSSVPIFAAVVSFVIDDSLMARLPTGLAGTYSVVFQRTLEPA